MRMPFAALLLLAVAGAQADPAAVPQKYAAISLIGDTLTVVTNARQTGSLIDSNAHDSFNVPPPVIDQPALIAIDDALQSVNPDLSAFLLGTSSAELREQQSQLVSNGRLKPSDMDAALAKTGATRLILVAKRRDATALQIEQEQIGNGSLYGLGFYLDRRRRLRRTDTEEAAVGYMAPYAYFNVFLIDVASGRVLGERSVTVGRVLSNARNKLSSDPWDILDPTHKIETINEMVREQILKAVPELIAAAN